MNGGTCARPAPRAPATKPANLDEVYRKSWDHLPGYLGVEDYEDLRTSTDQPGMTRQLLFRKLIVVEEFSTNPVTSEDGGLGILVTTRFLPPDEQLRCHKFGSMYKQYLAAVSIFWTWTHNKSGLY